MPLASMCPLRGMDILVEDWGEACLVWCILAYSWGKGRGGPVCLERQVAVSMLQKEVEARLGPYSEKLKSAIPRASDFILQAGRAIRA